MFSSVWNIITSIFIISRIVFVDMTLLMARPLVPLNYYVLHSELLTALYDDSLIIGVCTTITIGIILSLLVLVFNISEKSFRAIFFPITILFMIDGLSHSVRVFAHNGSYPINSGAFWTIQIVSPLICMDIVKPEYLENSKFFKWLYWAYPFHVLSNFYVEGISSVILDVLKYCLIANAVIPDIIFEKLYQLFHSIIIALVTKLFSVVFICLDYIYPFMVSSFWSFWSFWSFINKFMKIKIITLVQAYVFDPIWRCLTPLAMPIFSGLICVRFWNAQLILFESQNASYFGVNTICLLLCRGYITVCAAVSALVLGIHAITRFQVLLRQPPIQPFRNKFVCRVFRCILLVLISPWRLLQQFGNILSPVLESIIRTFRYIVERIHEFMSHFVKFCFDGWIVGVPLLLLICYAAMKASIATDGFKIMENIIMPASGFSKEYFSQLLLSHEITESTSILLLISAVQLSVFVCSYQQVGSIFHGFVISNVDYEADLTVLNEIAATMTDPRMCAVCNIGPIDHSGCSDLRAHHLETYRHGSSRYSNSCPRCGWFASNIDRWPYWNGTDRSQSNNYQLSKWNEFVIYVRAGSKLLAVCYTLLYIGKYLNLPLYLTLFLPVSYIIPWIVQNFHTFEAMQSISGIQGSRHDYPRRNLRAVSINRNANNNIDDATDCCANRAANRNIAASRVDAIISEEAALENLLNAAPLSVFLAPGDECSICMEPYPDDAVSAAKSESPSSKLRSITPPIIALRCGHTLHMQCATVMVKSSSNHHTRCPLCREPVTMGGAVVARMFA